MLRRLSSRIRRRTIRPAFDASYVVDRYAYVFIVTYGRSGSTLLMSLLNTIPGYRVCGENYNALYRIYQADAAIEKAHRTSSGASNLAPTSAWYGAPRFRPGVFRRDLINSFVANVLRPQPGDRVLGFKEIRHTESHVPDLSDYLKFLRQAFPNCRIVFNHRAVSDVAKSSWWTQVGRAAEKIKAADERLLAIPADEQQFHFFYDGIDDSLDNIRELFHFLGEKLDERAVREVLGTPHSPPSARFARNVGQTRDGAGPQTHDSAGAGAVGEQERRAGSRQPAPDVGA